MEGQTLERHSLTYQKYKCVQNTAGRPCETQRDTARPYETLRDTARPYETQRDTARHSETLRDRTRPCKILKPHIESECEQHVSVRLNQTPFTLSTCSSATTVQEPTKCPIL